MLETLILTVVWKALSPIYVKILYQEIERPGRNKRGDGALGNTSFPVRCCLGLNHRKAKHGMLRGVMGSVQEKLF